MYSKSSSALPLASFQSNLNYVNHTHNSTEFTSSNGDFPDLSHLSEAEQKIIEAVLERQRADEEASPVSEKYNTLPLRRNTITSNATDHNAKSNLHQCHSITDIAQECKQRYGSIDTGNVCDVCKKTKFTHIGSGHSCFNCKSRCCVKCAYRYTTKTKQLWACIVCKKKQEDLLKSGKWLMNPVLSSSKKNYTSDYILNKAAEVGIGLNQPVATLNNTESINNELTDLVNSIDKNFKTEKKSLPTLPSTSARKLPVPGARQLPQINKSQMDKVKYNTYIQTSNSAQSVPELTRDNESFYNQKDNSINQQNNKSPLNSSSINPSNEDSRMSNTNKKSFRMRQPLIKQASLNNPPTYNPELSNNEDLYEKNKNKIFTSNQELTMMNSSFTGNNLNENQYFSSPSSSISQINQSSSNNNGVGRRERLQDPLKILKTIRNSSSHLNSLNNLNGDNPMNASNLNIQGTNNENSPGNTFGVAQNPIIESINKTAISKQKQRSLKTMLHTDSLSSDPSDYQSLQNYQSDFQDISGDNGRKPSKKRTTRPRKQPCLPGGTSLQQEQQLKQKLLQKVLMKQNLKQHSLTSSDENLADEFEKNNETNSNENLNDTQNLEQPTDYLEEEDDDEIRSTTEYTTNDEMDLESGSVSIPAHTRVQTLPFPGTRSTLGKVLPTIESKSIDDYLMQNLKKEEILAAKMSKFLSPVNWQLSSDGKKMVGHIILKRNQINQSVKSSSSSSTLDSSIEYSSSSSLGVKIIGGKINPITNQLSAYVVKLKKESIADTVGRLQIGDEILKWNGYLLRGLAYDEVYSIMSQSKQDLQVELSAERLMHESDRSLLKNLIPEMNLAPENPDLHEEDDLNPPLASFDSGLDITLLKSCPTDKSTVTKSSYHGIKQLRPTVFVKKSKSFSSIEKSSYSKIDKYSDVNSFNNRSTPADTASIYFSFNPHVCQFNTIDKSLIKKKESNNRNAGYKEICLLSIELNSPVQIKNKQLIEETPILINKLNKNQMRLNRLARELTASVQEFRSSPLADNTLTPVQLILKNHQSGNPMYFNTDSNSPKVKSKNERRKYEKDLPHAAPNCIQSLTEILKLIKNKFRFNHNKSKMSRPELKCSNSVANSITIRRQQYLCA